MEKKKKKFALGIQYNGSNYHGWQRQKNILTVQEEIENALSKVANHNIKVICSGRTDAGVHSIGQVIDFTTTALRNDYSWTVGVNGYLPKNISVQWIREVPLNFSARYSAIHRSYRYLIYNHNCRTSIAFERSHHVYRKLNIKKMYKEAQSLLGEHDFSSFRASGCQSYSTWRNIKKINIFGLDNWVIIDITANSFLYRMVRNIVGSLIQVSFLKENNCIKKILEKKNRFYAGPTASAHGLYLWYIKYPESFNLPMSKSNFIF